MEVVGRKFSHRPGNPATVGVVSWPAAGDTAGSSLRRLNSLQHRIYNLLDSDTHQSLFGPRRRQPGQKQQRRRSRSCFRDTADLLRHDSRPQRRRAGGRCALRRHQDTGVKIFGADGVPAADTDAETTTSSWSPASLQRASSAPPRRVPSIPSLHPGTNPFLQRCDFFALRLPSALCIASAFRVYFPVFLPRDAMHPRY